jgi:putative nucleotidyltransferase with HDIG domain
MKHSGSTATRIRRIAESIINLPTLPTVVAKMIQLVDNPKTSAGSLARLISTDQALTARILKLANSAYYGFPRTISTVNTAIVVLGFNAVKDMGLSLSVFDMFKDTGSSGPFDIMRFWEHSMGCGIASRMIARRFRPDVAGEAFVAGLLHDIGKAVLKQYCPAEFQEIMRLVSSQECDLDEAELRVTGTQHSEVGGWLAEKWNLPRLIVESIMYHHEPWTAHGDPIFVALVAIADYLCHRSAVGSSGRRSPPVLDERVWLLLEKSSVRLTPDDLDNLEADFLLEFDRSEAFVAFMQEEAT